MIRWEVHFCGNNFWQTSIFPSFHCHPKLSRKYRERKVARWTGNVWKMLFLLPPQYLLYISIIGGGEVSPTPSFFFPTHLFLQASQHWDRLGSGFLSANLYNLLGWGGYKSRAAGPPSRSKREAWCRGWGSGVVFKQGAQGWHVTIRGGVRCRILMDFGGEMRWGWPQMVLVLPVWAWRTSELWRLGQLPFVRLGRLSGCELAPGDVGNLLPPYSLYHWKSFVFPYYFRIYLCAACARICLCIAGAQLYTWWHTCAYHVHERCHSANPCVSFLFVIVQIGWWSHAMNLYVSDGGRNTTLSRKKWYCFFGTEKVKTTLDLVAQSNDTWFDWTPKNGTILIRFRTCMPIMIFQHESMNPNWATTLAQ